MLDADNVDYDRICVHDTQDLRGQSVSKCSWRTYTAEEIKTRKACLVDNNKNSQRWQYCPAYNRLCHSPAWVQIDLKKMMYVGKIVIHHYHDIGGPPRRQGTFQLLHPAPPYYPISRGKIHTRGNIWGFAVG